MIRPLTVTVIALVAVPALAAPAHAALWSKADPTGDVFSEATFAAEPGIAEGDIVRGNIRHQDRRVLYRIRMRQVTAALPRTNLIRITTDEGLVRGVRMISDAGVMQPDLLALVNRDGDQVRCPGLWAGNDPNLDVVTVIVPRSCLGYPRWVRTGVTAITRDAQGNLRYDFLNKPLTGSAIIDDDLGARVYRG